MLELKWEKDEVCEGSETSGFKLKSGEIVQIIVVGKTYDIIIDDEFFEKSTSTSNIAAKFEAIRLAMQHAATRCISQIL